MELHNNSSPARLTKYPEALAARIERERAQLKAQHIQLLITINCTLSMQLYLGDIRHQQVELLESLSQQYPHLETNVMLYRELGREPTGPAEGPWTDDPEEGAKWNRYPIAVMRTPSPGFRSPGNKSLKRFLHVCCHARDGDKRAAMGRAFTKATEDYVWTAPKRVILNFGDQNSHGWCREPRYKRDPHATEDVYHENVLKALQSESITVCMVYVPTKAKPRCDLVEHKRIAEQTGGRFTNYKKVRTLDSLLEFLEPAFTDNPKR